MKLEDKVVETARKYIGVKETPMGSNNVIFNTKFYGHAVSSKTNDYQWCCVFVWYIFNELGLDNLFGGKFCACRDYEINAIHRNEQVPITQLSAGDIVTYDFGNTGVAHHIGIVVEKLDDNNFKVIEGNTGDMVQEKTRSLKTIRKAFRPKYDSVTAQNAPESILRPTIEYFPMLKIKDKSAAVRVLQYMLNFVGDYNLEIDGDFGRLTKSAVEHYQTQKNIEVDGIVGNITWNNLIDEVFWNLDARVQ